MKNWNWLIMLQRDCGELPEISEVVRVVAERIATEAVTIVDADELLMSEEYLLDFDELLEVVPEEVPVELPEELPEELPDVVPPDEDPPELPQC